MARPGVARPGTAWRGEARHGMARQGKARFFLSKRDPESRKFVLHPCHTNPVVWHGMDKVNDSKGEPT